MKLFFRKVIVVKIKILNVENVRSWIYNLGNFEDNCVIYSMYKIFKGDIWKEKRWVDLELSLYLFKNILIVYCVYYKISNIDYSLK